MNKTELISAVAQEAGLPKATAARAVDSVINVISTALSEGDNVKISGFGNFEVRERSERTGLNPRTQEKIHIPAGKSPVFKPSKNLKEKC